MEKFMISLVVLFSYLLKATKLLIIIAAIIIILQYVVLNETKGELICFTEEELEIFQ